MCHSRSWAKLSPARYLFSLCMQTLTLRSVPFFLYHRVQKKSFLLRSAFLTTMILFEQLNIQQQNNKQPTKTKQPNNQKTNQTKPNQTTTFKTKATAAANNKQQTNKQACKQTNNKQHQLFDPRKPLFARILHLTMSSGQLLAARQRRDEAATATAPLMAET